MAKKQTPAEARPVRRPPRPAARGEDPLPDLVGSLGGGPEPVLALDGEGDVLHAAARGRSLDLAGTSVAELVAPEDVDRVLAAVHHATHPGIPQTVDATVTLGGRGRRMRLRFVPQRVAGRVAAVLVTCTDVDALHRELEALRRAERLMRDTQGMSHVGTWYWDITQPHAEWSEQLYRIYGLDPATHAPTYEDYLTRVHPDDVERVRAATEAVFRDHQPYSHDERIRHADGSWRHLHTWAEAVLVDGALVALQGVCMDITDRKEAETALVETEARQRSILEHAGLGIATLAPDGGLEDANPAFRLLLGRGDRLWDLLDGAGCGEAQALLDGLFGGADRVVETTVHAGGTGRWVRLILSLVADGRDEPFVVALAQDVSAEHAARQAQRRVADLEAAGRRRDTMLGVASHEIKNPLTPIRTELALLRRDLPPDRRTELIDRIDEQVRRVSGVVRDLLDAVRAGEAGIPLRRRRTDLAQVARLAVDGLRDQARAWGVELRLDAPGPAWADGDPTRLRQVVDNLVSNALRHAPDGTAVEVRVAADRVEVLDRGAGIPDEVRGALFEPYAASEAHATHGGASTGLGLYLCREVVHAHGGRIGLEDRDGGGTRAWFTVPAAPDA